MTIRFNKNLIFYSGYYKSSFEFNEILFLAGKFEKIILITTYDVDFTFPPNVYVYKLNIKDYRTRKILSIRFLFIALQVLFDDLAFRKFNLKYIKRWKRRVSLFFRNYYLSEILHKDLVLLVNYEESIFYSFWLNDGATIFSILTKTKKISHYYSRAHGSDLYDERESYTQMIPFRKFQIRYCKNVFTVSKKGEIYLQQKFPEYRSKIKCLYLGSYDFGTAPLPKDKVFTILSVAYIVNLKRLTLIAEILKKIPFEIKWIHIGSDDSGLLKNDAKRALLEKFNELKDYKNVTVDFRGDLLPFELHKVYMENAINLFVSVSETEGLPVSMMEAISAGIPIISTDVGGCSEIVNEETGILIPKDFYIDNVVKEISNFKDSQKNTVDYRKGVRRFWENNFDAKNNYELLIKKINE